MNCFRAVEKSSRSFLFFCYSINNYSKSFKNLNSDIFIHCMQTDEMSYFKIKILSKFVNEKHTF